MPENKDIYQLGRPFFCIVKSLGLACYTFNFKTKCFRATRFDKFLLFISLSVWLVTSLIHISRVCHVEYDSGIESQIIDSVWFYQFILTHFFGFWLVVFSFKQRSVFEKLLKTIFDVDEKLKCLGWRVNSQNKLFKTAVLSYLGFFLVTTSFTALTAIEDNWSEKLSVMTIVFNVYECCYIMLFYLVVAKMLIISAFCVRDRLTVIITNLR